MSKGSPRLSPPGSATSRRATSPRACASSARAPAPAPCRSHDEAAARIRAYLTDRGGPSRAVRDLAVLFVRHDRSAFTPAALRRLVERWYASAGVRRHPGAAVHALRHTWTTPRSTPAPRSSIVQTLLGHASLEATRRYLAAIGSGLDDVAAAHPTRHILRRRGAATPHPQAVDGAG